MDADLSSYFNSYITNLSQKPISETLTLYSRIGNGTLSQEQENIIQASFTELKTEFEHLSKESKNSPFIKDIHSHILHSFNTHPALPRLYLESTKPNEIKPLELTAFIDEKILCSTKEEFLLNCQKGKKSSLICDQNMYSAIHEEIPIDTTIYKSIYNKDPFQRKEKNQKLDLNRENNKRFCELLYQEKLPFMKTQLNPVYYSDPLSNTLYSGINQLYLQSHSVKKQNASPFYILCKDAFQKGYSLDVFGKQSVLLSKENGNAHLHVIPYSYYKELKEYENNIPNRLPHINRLSQTALTHEHLKSKDEQEFLTSHLRKYFNASFTKSCYETSLWEKPMIENIIKKTMKNPMFLKSCAYEAFTQQPRIENCIAKVTSVKPHKSVQHI